MPPRHDTTAVSERIEDVDVVSEMQDSYLEYAYSVIYSRALPDARDGLKPVQRRILFQMSQMGLRPDRGHVKSARVTGEVMGKLHPHGDSAIYDALVRMAQDFTLRVPLIDGHGNFGSLDDGPAAARYTEVRLAPAALAMTEDLDEDVVDFVPNYDDQLTQPSVLSSALPNLLVNGASGIAVGMATNMPPHNLGEVIEAACHLLAHPDAGLDDLMRFVPGPDLPGGATIVGTDGIKEAYASGRGAFKTRARVSIEKITARRTGLVVTELPYLVGPEKVIEKIKQAVRQKKLLGVSDVDDLTDGTKGLRLVIGVKTGFDPRAVLERLYHYTPLEDSFAINNVALVDGSPRTLGLRDLLQVYIDHRIQVVTRRSRFRLQRHLDRLHLVEGLLVAVLDIDEVIQLIRDSDDADEARARLMKVFDLSRLQSDYILELRLRRLTKFSRIELESEREELTASIARLRALLADNALLRQTVADELRAAAERYGSPRRTVLLGARPQSSSPASPASLEMPDEACRIILTADGLLLRTDPKEPAGEEHIGRRIRHDAVGSSIEATTRSRIGVLTSAGRIRTCIPVELPALPSGAMQFKAGVDAAAYAGADAQEEVIALVTASSMPLAIGTAGGVVKRIMLEEWPNKSAFQVIGLKPGDRIVGASTAADEADLVFVTSDAQLLRFPAAQVRPQGLAAAGMTGISLHDGANVLFFGAIPAQEQDACYVATIAAEAQTLLGVSPGSAKISAFTEFPRKGRATSGVRSHRLLAQETALRLAWVGPGPIHALDGKGKPCTLPAEPAKRDAAGQKLDTVVSFLGGAFRR